MTIIEPHKSNLSAGGFLFVGIIVLIFAVFSIRFYNANVNLRYNIGVIEKTMQEFELKNADLRNNLYRQLDGQNSAALIEKYNFIQDKNPDYVEYKLANR